MWSVAAQCPIGDRLYLSCVAYCLRALKGVYDLNFAGPMIQHFLEALDVDALSGLCQAGGQ